MLTIPSAYRCTPSMCPSHQFCNWRVFRLQGWNQGVGNIVLIRGEQPYCGANFDLSLKKSQPILGLYSDAFFEAFHTHNKPQLTSYQVVIHQQLDLVTILLHPWCSARANRYYVFIIQITPASLCARIRNHKMCTSSALHCVWVFSVKLETNNNSSTLGCFDNLYVPHTHTKTLITYKKM